MARYRVAATIIKHNDGWSSTKQVPLFSLDGQIHGLLSEKGADRFAEEVLLAIAGEAVTVKACAVLED